MNVDGREVHSESLAEAMARFAAAKAQGAQLIDIGCMQINAHFHGGAFRVARRECSTRARNVDYAANFLEEPQGRGGHLDAGRRPLQRRPGQPGGGAHLRLRGHPQHGGERLRPMDRQCAGALPIGPLLAHGWDRSGAGGRGANSLLAGS